ncbi:unnamed protein product [Cylindrotheca closterium]|uniref:DNA (cytosine-5-)-methyltransferase n=1 Tax=Cylindrotheca closterium TaxID=2856 RepID=A0AAD2JLG9_9STRA|nr:unnamed protein product [Cylindrotheca closterium]
MSTCKGLRMIEFFSGIGGMRFSAERGIQESQETSIETCQAYDISLHANNSYKHNFPNDSVRTKLVEQLKPKDLDGKADLWTMSPPCQPFTTTRGAKSLDSEDKRCNGLKGIMDLLTQILEKPKYIFLENVKGFSGSQMIGEWYKCLKENGYTYKQYLVSPVQIGVPNHRQRYYILCERSDRWNDETIIHQEIKMGKDDVEKHIVGDYIDDSLTAEDRNTFLVPDEILQKDWARQVGVVSKADTATHCFTAGYGRIFHRATGSLLLTRDSEDSVEDNPIDRSNMMEYSGQLRRFTPKELLCLFGFPHSFEFPDSINLEHQYKLIGNSINVNIVALLLKELLVGDVDVVRGSKERLQVGGTKGHVVEEIDGNLMQLYHGYRWKMIPNCTGRHTCRDPAKVSSVAPLEILKEIGIAKKSASEFSESVNDADMELKEYHFELPGRADKIHVIPLDTNNDTGMITFAKEERGAYVHTLNTSSGFRRKLACIGIEVTSNDVRLDENFPHPTS